MEMTGKGLIGRRRNDRCELTTTTTKSCNMKVREFGDRRPVLLDRLRVRLPPRFKRFSSSLLPTGRAPSHPQTRSARCATRRLHRGADCRSDPQQLTGDKAVAGEDVRRDAARASSNVVICRSRHGNGVTGKALISVACYTAAWSPFVIDAFPSASPTKMARYKSSP